MKKLLKINAPLKKHKVGDVISIEFKDGKPVSPYWQRRLEDAKTDKCVEIVKAKKSST